MWIRLDLHIQHWTENINIVKYRLVNLASLAELESIVPYLQISHYFPWEFRLGILSSCKKLKLKLITGG